jgi:hypothetical protein
MLGEASEVSPHSFQHKGAKHCEKADFHSSNVLLNESLLHSALHPVRDFTALPPSACFGLGGSASQLRFLG